jgi:small nuclear ribonucleoprotein
VIKWNYQKQSFWETIKSQQGDFMDQSRPLDALNKARGKRVIVELKNNKQFIGNLEAFDIHINVVLNDAEERVDGEVKRKLGTVFVRGDTITIISTQ